MTKNKGLGKGIDALFADYSTFEEIDQKEQIKHIPLTQLIPNPYQPRKEFEPNALKELAESIQQSGVFQPIIVRKKEHKYEIIAGERRFRASQLVNKETIPAIVRMVDEETTMQIAVLENLQREDLSPIEEAHAYETLMQNLKLTQEELAKRLGKSRPYIANYLRLLTLPTSVKELLQTQTLSMGQARTLLGLKNKKQMLQLANKAVKENLTVRQLEQLVNKMNTKKKQEQLSSFQEKPYYIQAFQNRLEEKLDTKVVIYEKKGKGKIEISYLSNDQLQHILDVLAISLEDDEEEKNV